MSNVRRRRWPSPLPSWKRHCTNGLIGSRRGLGCLFGNPDSPASQPSFPALKPRSFRVILGTMLSLIFPPSDSLSLGVSNIAQLTNKRSFCEVCRGSVASWIGRQMTLRLSSCFLCFFESIEPRDQQNEATAIQQTAGYTSRWSSIAADA